MELELKYLAPYLPYDLKVKHESRLGNIKKEAILTMSDFTWLRNQKYFKPMLRKKTYLHRLQDEILIRWGGGLSNNAKGKWLKEVTDNMMYSAFNSLSYDVIEFMLENHIDVFGLIDAGLATELE